MASEREQGSAQKATNRRIDNVISASVEQLNNPLQKTLLTTRYTLRNYESYCCFIFGDRNANFI